jgi:hypothetical protein
MEETLSAEQTIMMLTESIVRALGRSRTSPESTKRSAKIPDPATLTDSQDPTFESWKIQIQDKLKINVDHFLTEEACKAYVFACTGGDAQTYLRPCYSDDSVNLFNSTKDMIDYLVSILEDLYKVQNARYDYKSLRMKTTEKFSEFQTRFLQLAREARIPSDDLMPDLFDKLTLELRRTILPQYTTMTSLTQLTNQCQAVDQGLRRIKAETDRLKKNQAVTECYRIRKPDYAPYQAFTEHNQSARPAEVIQAPVRNRGSVL